MALIIIDHFGDVIVEVTEILDDVKSPDANKVTSQTQQFRVSRAVLSKASQPLLRMLIDPHWKEAAQNVISLGEGRVAVTEVWLRVIHKVKVVVNLPLPEFWYLVQAIDYYELDVTKFNDGFATWYEKNNGKLMTDQRELLFPTWRFDHAKAFAHSTCTLAYDGIGHVKEKNPSKLWVYHLPSRFIQQLNAAKGRLRTVLHRGLFGPCDKLFNATCACKEMTLYSYQKHLFRIGVWPLETVFIRKSMSQILGNLDAFSYEAPASACGSCKQDYKGIVAGIQESVQEYFDGLCLDCMNRSKPKTGSIDRDYWKHNELKENEYVQGCRFRHKQPTWYFSFMGRVEERDRLVKQKQREKRMMSNPFYEYSDDSSD